MKMNRNLKREKMNAIKSLFINYNVQQMCSRTSLILLLALVLNTNANAQCENINLACNNQINVSINEDCYAAITADLILENPPLDVFPDDGQNYIIRTFDEFNRPIMPSNQIGHDYVGQLIKTSVTLEPCGLTCWGNVLVEDKIGPKIWNCVNGELPVVQIDCDDFTDGFVVPEPILGSFCVEEDSLTFYDDTSSLDCNLEFAININRIWTASDAAGNSTSCNQLIQVRKFDLKDIVMPDDFNEIIDQDKECSVYLDVSPEVTGYPTGIHCPNIMFYFNDLEYPQCGYQKKILRDWNVIDWCTGLIASHGQIIKYIDKTPPQVVCNIDTLLVGTDAHACGAFPVLNPFKVLGFDTLGTFTVLDTCPDNISIEVGFLPAQLGFPQPLDDPYYVIPQDEDGTYKLPEVEDHAWIRYCFSDDCGNTTQIASTIEESDSLGFCHYFKLKAQDDTPPTAICEGFTKIQLTSTGEVEVPADRFDDNSYDPCGEILRFEVRRESTSCPGFNENGNDGWGESIHFCCNDLNDTITIRLRVFDMEGNFSECLGLVCVSDPRTPTVQCPTSPLTLACGDDFRDHTLIGLPTGDNGCEAGLVYGLELFDLSNFDTACGIGSILRTIEVNDSRGNLLETCSQTIVFPSTAATPLLSGDFDFPEDITLDICDTGGSLDPSFTGIPTSTKEFGCSNINVTYEDTTPFEQNVLGVCYTILRTWKVVDWCNYHPSIPNQHILVGEQQIQVTDTSVPFFSCPSSLSFNANGIDCEKEVDFQVGVSSSCNSTFEISWTIDEFSDGSVDYEGTGLSIDGVYPVGIHTAEFSGYNLCGGSSSSCEFTFEVIGDRPPLPICLATVTWSIGSNGSTEIWASDFDLKSEGGCGLDELTFSFVEPGAQGFPKLAETYDCSDIPTGTSSTLPIRVYVVDEDGRYSSCTSILDLQDTQDVCLDTGSKAIVTGGILTEKLEPLNQVMVELYDMKNEMMMMNMTNSNGSFEFSELEIDNEYLIDPSHNYNHLNGVSTLDLVMLQRHILGLSKLESPYKIIAGDVDNSGGLNVLDLVHLRKLILGVYEEFPENESWVFVPKQHTFVDVNSPWDYPQEISIYDVKGAYTDLDFVAVKIGDVNNSVEVEHSKRRNKQSEAFYLSTIEGEYNKGDLVAFPIIAENDMDIYGLQFSLDFNDIKLNFEGIDNGQFEINQDNFALLNNYNGMMTFSVSSPQGKFVEEGETLFTLYFEAKLALKSSDVVRLGNSNMDNEVYFKNGKTHAIEMVVKSEGLIAEELEVFQNEPNPFSSVSRIPFSIKKGQNISLDVFDAKGKLVYKETQFFNKGVNEFVINSGDLLGSGIMVYRISSENAIATRKMIVVK